MDKVFASLWWHLNLKMLSIQYCYSQYKDEMVSQLCRLYDGNIHTLQDILYIEAGPRASHFIYHSYLHVDKESKDLYYWVRFY